jgi:hypothetical protein
MEEFIIVLTMIQELLIISEGQIIRKNECTCNGREKLSYILKIFGRL